MVFEEAGIKANADYLAVVCENFFRGHGGSIDGLDCHTIEFYYYMKFSDDEVKKCKSVTDDGEELVWLPVEKIKTSNIKPDFIKEEIDRIINDRQTLHIVEERDR